VLTKKKNDYRLKIEQLDDKNKMMKEILEKNESSNVENI